MHITKNILALLLCLSVILPGCAHKNAPTQEDIERQGEKYNALSKSKAFGITDGPYLGAKAKALDGDESALNMQVTLRMRGTLAALGTSLHDLTSLTVHIGEADADPLEKKPLPQGLPPSLDLPELPALPSGSGPAKTLAVNYEGPLRGLLDQISAQSGYGWDYDAQSNSILFARMMVRTFTLLATPGGVDFENQITNRSKETQNGTIGSSTRGVNQAVSQTDTSTQTAQVNKNKLKFDLWADTEAGVKNLLSKQGSVSVNQASGTITVRDRPDHIRQVRAFVRDTNLRISRQVALKVQVWSLEIGDDNEAGLDLQVLFQNNDVDIVAGSLAALGGLNTASATIVAGKLKGSTAVLKALKQWGNATQITSGGGIAMNNNPFPVNATTNHKYLAGVSSSVTDYGQTSEITPGEVTTGFAMTVVPHILDKRRVILQYNIDLSTLDEMKEYKNADIMVQLPQVSKRAFAQRATMQLGQTLVLAGFQQEIQTRDNSFGLLGLGRKAGYGKSLLVITIEIESAGSGMESSVSNPSLQTKAA